MSRRNRGSRPPKRERELIRELRAQQERNRRAVKLPEVAFAVKVAVVDLLTASPVAMFPDLPPDCEPQVVV